MARWGGGCEASGVPFIWWGGVFLFHYSEHIPNPLLEVDKELVSFGLWELFDCDGAVLGLVLDNLPRLMLEHL